LSLDTLEYLGLLVLPVIWGLAPQHLTPLVSAIPTLVLNILSDKHAQRNLIHQYSVPVLPFLLLAVISSLAAKRGWLRSRRVIALWSLLTFLAWQSMAILGQDIWIHSTLGKQRGKRSLKFRNAIKPTLCAVFLTTHKIAPHLTHRRLIKWLNRRFGEMS
jgi:uncharacterized membrane protein